MKLSRKRLAVVAAIVVSLGASGCGSDTSGDAGTTSAGKGGITVYSGRNEALVGTLLKKFTADTGIKVSVRYADSASLAAQLVEEGSRSPADVFFSQDAGALGSLSKRGLLAKAPAEAVQAVEARYRSKDD
ncbi:MAG: extracellular solute-binding protein, partial [Acidimicrobiales bacterium]